MLWDVRTAREVLSIPLKRGLERHRISFPAPGRIALHEDGVIVSFKPRVVGTGVFVIDGTPAEDDR